MSIFSLRYRFLVLIGMLMLTSGAPAFAQGEGARAYQLVPDGTQSIAQYFYVIRGNNTPSTGLIVQGAELDLNLAVTQYAKSIDLNGRQTGLIAVLPYGNISGSLNTIAGNQSDSASGLGDLLLGGVFGLVGSPVLNEEQYIKYDPGFAMALLARLTVPTGRYDSDSTLNMGGNRWVFELGLPTMYFVGSSFLDPDLMSFEILPKVTLFGDNTDAPGTVGTLEQRPLYSLEAHVTRNFGQAFWGSLDAFYQYGGETVSDGSRDGNRQRSFGLGVTGALNLSEKSLVKATYGEVISSNVAGSDGSVFRLQYQYLF